MTTVPDTTGYNNQPNTDYTLTNNFTGPSVPLSAYLNTTDGNTYLSSSNASSATPINSWTFTPTAATKYRICTSQLKGTTICLDILTSSSTSSNHSKATTPYLTTSAATASQSWTLTPWESSDGTLRLTNELLGPQLHLDIHTNTKGAFMSGDQEGSGQHWILTEVETPADSENPPWEAPSASPSVKSASTSGALPYSQASKAAEAGGLRGLVAWIFVVAALLMGILF